MLSNVRGYGAPEPGRWKRQTVVELAPAGEGSDAAAAAVGGRCTVKRVWPQQAYYAPFPEHEILLVGEGDGGGPLLVQNGRRIDDPHNPVPDERYVRNPVFAVGITQDGRTMFLVAVDGRQSRLSIGLTQPQLAAYRPHRAERRAQRRVFGPVFARPPRGLRRQRLRVGQRAADPSRERGRLRDHRRRDRHVPAHRPAGHRLEGPRPLEFQEDTPVGVPSRDAIAAAAVGTIEDVTITSRKPPRGFPANVNANPRAGVLTGMSVLAMIKKLTSPLRVGT